MHDAEDEPIRIMKWSEKIYMIILWSVFAVICILYGIFIKAAGSGTGFFIVWLGLGVLFLLFAFAAKLELWSRLPRLIKWICLAGTAIGIVCFLVIEGCIIREFNEKGKPQLDYIIVLGAQVYENGRNTLILRAGSRRQRDAAPIVSGEPPLPKSRLVPAPPLVCGSSNNHLRSGEPPHP